MGSEAQHGQHVRTLLVKSHFCELLGHPRTCTQEGCVTYSENAGLCENIASVQLC